QTVVEQSEILMTNLTGDTIESSWMAWIRVTFSLHVDAATELFSFRPKPATGISVQVLIDIRDSLG
ncbi:MAG: hypothetical protein MJE63_18000, partial [Proteobacteria bacterium]|nr:hypothetical protein [Pseudomonadota bacterium]